MIEHELLELAAKAAGYEYIKPLDEYEGNLGLQVGSTNPMRTYTWNPLEDDVDALRLAVTLNMKVSIPVQKDNRINVITFRNSMVNVIEKRNDAITATRRAIVRAAAEIGRKQAAKATGHEDSSQASARNW